MECSCEISSYDNDYDEITLYIAKVRKANKKHICGECYREIKPKEKYEYVTYLYEGSFSKHKTCMDCLSVRKQFYSGGWMFGNIWEDIDYHIEQSYGDIPEACISKMTPTGRSMVCDIIQKYHDIMNEEN